MYYYGGKAYAKKGYLPSGDMLLIGRTLKLLLKVSSTLWVMRKRSSSNDTT